MENITRQESVGALSKELDAVHLANRLYWEQGESANPAARAEYQRRLERLSAIRSDLQVTFSS
jgi:hypothetical protein